MEATHALALQKLNLLEKEMNCVIWYFIHSCLVFSIAELIPISLCIVDDPHSLPCNHQFCK